jgi:hypothetical protein
MRAASQRFCSLLIFGQIISFLDGSLLPQRAAGADEV